MDTVLVKMMITVKRTIPEGFAEVSRERCEECADYTECKLILLKNVKKSFAYLCVFCEDEARREGVVA